MVLLNVAQGAASTTTVLAVASIRPMHLFQACPSQLNPIRDRFNLPFRHGVCAIWNVTTYSAESGGNTLVSLSNAPRLVTPSRM